MSLMVTTTPLQILRGKITSLNSISVDRSLSIDGASADAKSTGDGIVEAKRIAAEHIGNTNNPHGVTKKQLGLDNVDNTSDADKPVSTLQAEAIKEAKKAGSDAKAAADEAKSAADMAQIAAGNAQTSADNAQTAADEAKSAAKVAQETANSKTSMFTAKVTLNFADWNENKLTVNVPGVTADENQPIFVAPTLDSEEAYNLFDVKPIEQGENTITFSCEDAPDGDIALNVVGFTVHE